MRRSPESSLKLLSNPKVISKVQLLISSSLAWMRVKRTTKVARKKAQRNSHEAKARRKRKIKIQKKKKS
jgi:hypothetical protein